MKRLICLLLSVVIFIGIFTGCYDRREVDDLAYIIAFGLDKGKTNKLKLTLQIAIPSAIGGGGQGGGGGGGEESLSTITVESASFLAGLNMANNVISRQINLSHAKAMVFSKELAMKGIEGYINGFPRVKEVRPNINVIIAKDSAEEYIKNVQPQLEVNPAKYYELNFAAHEYTGFTANSQFFEFLLKAKTLFSQPVATLAGVSKNESSNDFDLKGSTYKSKGREFPLEGDFKAGDLPKASKLKAEVMGLAVFDGAKMVGELDGEETSYYLMATGEYRHAFITMQDPRKKESFIILDVKQSRLPKDKVRMVNGKPHISLQVILEADIQAIQSGINYEKPKKLAELEKAYEDFIKRGMLRFLKKTSEEYNADICAFGDKVKRQMLTWKEWEKYGWLKKYGQASFDVNVDMKIRRPGLVINTSPIRTSEGER